jgi:hypothetical protein
MHPATVVVGVLTVAAVGWFLPLFATSLAAFIVLDAVIGTVRNRRARSALAR